VLADVKLTTLESLTATDLCGLLSGQR
jgi:hypothetical protein